MRTNSILLKICHLSGNSLYLEILAPMCSIITEFAKQISFLPGSEWWICLVRIQYSKIRNMWAIPNYQQIILSMKMKRPSLPVGKYKLQFSIYWTVHVIHDWIHWAECMIFRKRPFRRWFFPEEHQHQSTDVPRNWDSDMPFHKHFQLMRSRVESFVQYSYSMGRRSCKSSRSTCRDI